MKRLIVGIGNKPSLLETLARKIEPSDGALAAAGKLPKHSRRARLILNAADIPQMKDKLDHSATDGRQLIGPHAARHTGVQIAMQDHEAMAFYSDGSLRHVGGRLKGKRIRKALKRARRAA